MKSYLAKYFSNKILVKLIPLYFLDSKSHKLKYLINHKTFFSFFIDIHSWLIISMHLKYS